MSLEIKELTLTLEQLLALPVRGMYTLDNRPALAVVQRTGEASWVFAVSVNTKPFDPAAAMREMMALAGGKEPAS